MEDLVLIAFGSLLVILLLGYFLVSVWRESAKRIDFAKARWRVEDQGDGHGMTHIVLRKVVESHGERLVLDTREVASIPDNDPEYSDKYTTALAEAQARMSLLR